MQIYEFGMTVQTSLVAAVIVSLVAVGFAACKAISCSAGWQVWVCYQLTRLHSAVFTRCSAATACTYPEHGAAIIVANHTSPADPMLLWTGHFAQFKKPRLRVIGFMMAKEYYVRGGLLSWICRTMQSIPVERSGRDMAPIREALRRLQDGHLLGLFPEGGINVEAPDERLRAAGTGVAWLALRSRAPVIPVFIQNAPRSTSMVRVFLNRTHSRLIFGPPIDLSKWKNEKPSHTDLIEVTDLIMQTIAALGGIQASPTIR